MQCTKYSMINKNGGKSMSYLGNLNMDWVFADNKELLVIFLGDIILLQLYSKITFFLADA